MSKYGHHFTITNNTLIPLDSVVFNLSNPSTEELAMLTIFLDEDLFAPFLTAVDWLQGKRKAPDN